MKLLKVIKTANNKMIHILEIGGRGCNTFQCRKNFGTDPSYRFPKKRKRCTL